jgi:hypothetical protein
MRVIHHNNQYYILITISELAELFTIIFCIISTLIARGLLA